MKSFTLLAAAALVSAISARAQNAEQVVFSTPGFTMSLANNSKATATPFGFWIWCSAEPATNSNGGYAANFACHGAMYFDAIDTNATPVLGHVVEGPDGIYTMHVVQGTFAQFSAGTLNPAYLCSLKNTVPDAQGNVSSSVIATCQFTNALGGGMGTATVTNATVQVTGPK